MNMIGHAADFEQNSAFSAHDAANVSVQVRLKRRRNERRPTLGAEYDVKQQIRVRARHNLPPYVAPPGLTTMELWILSTFPWACAHGYTPLPLRGIV